MAKERPDSRKNGHFARKNAKRQPIVGHGFNQNMFLRLILFLFLKMTSQIRNIALIAHVNHGRTTMVDQLLRQPVILVD